MGIEEHIVAFGEEAFGLGVSTEGGEAQAQPAARHGYAPMIGAAGLGQQRAQPNERIRRVGVPIPSSPGAMFSLTSTASEEDIRATMRAGYQTIGGNVEANLTAKQKTILRGSEITVTSFGGPANATLAVIRSGDWSQYFTDSAPLPTAEPLTYIFRNLGGDNDIARVSESTEYTLRTCTAREGSQATFDLLDADDLIVYNATFDETHVGLATPADGFDFTTRPVQSRPTPEDWSQFRLLVGDVNGDRQNDLVWVDASSRNRVYVGLALASDPV